MAGASLAVAACHADGTPGVGAAGTAPGAGSAGAVIPLERRTTWNPGLTAVGGIPRRTTACATLQPSGGDDTAAIQAALDTCPANQVVQLGEGVFRISGQGLVISRSQVTLRGSGSDRTRLVKVDQRTNLYTVVMIGPYRWSSGKFVSSIPLAADGRKGSHTLTLSRTPIPPLSAGEIVYLDQLTDPHLTRWSDRSPPGDASRGWFARMDRPLAQMVEVESAADTRVTLTTPLHIDFPTTREAELSRYGESGLVPATKLSGIEDLAVEGGAGGDGGGNVHFFVCAYCWVKGVESAHSLGTSVNLDGCFRCEVRDSFIHTSDNPNPGGDGYLVGLNLGAADNLVENNIVWNGNKVIVMRASGGGNVVAYNYFEDGYGGEYPTVVEIGLNASHMTTPHMELFEGNEAFNFDGDSVWGNSIYITVFRNHFTALRRSVAPLSLSDDINRRAVGLAPGHWWYNFVGNVLGTEGQTLLPGQRRFLYEYTGEDESPLVPMWKLGYGGETQDATVVARTLRHGNFDYVSNSVVWAANAERALPDSLYLTARPAFFGAERWPWVDPTGAPRLSVLPARARFDARAFVPQPPRPSADRASAASPTRPSPGKESR
jgi:hypothetical protein